VWDLEDGKSLVSFFAAPGYTAKKEVNGGSSE
jgi:hypothetical protein